VTRRVKVMGLCLAVLLVAASQLLPSASAGAQSRAPVHRVIIVLRNQVSNLPATRRSEVARHAAVTSLQAPIVSQLAASGARSVHRYTLINAISATVSGAEESRLRSDPAVSEVIPDEAIQLAPIFTPPTTRHRARSHTSGSGSAAATAACPAPGKVELDPEALSLIHADSDNPSEPTARKLGIDGSGVVVGFIADNLDINDPDFIRADGQHVFIDYKDFSGAGTNAPAGGGEAFGDASSIAAQGREVYNVEGYAPEGVSTPCRIRIEGVAPGASLVGLDVIATDGVDYNSTFMEAIDYAVTVDHVNVLNESLGINDYPDDTAALDLVKMADDAAVAAGTTVTVSSGDAGVTSTVGTPATDPGVIGAGGTTSYRLYAQTGFGGTTLPGVTGFLDDNISALSSGGFEQSGRTIDVVAPADLNWALCSTDLTTYPDCSSFTGAPAPFQAFGGTSEAAPLTAGVAALVYQAYKKTHGTWPSAETVKQIITGTAQNIAAPADQQGSGLLDAYQAVLAAESYRAPASTPPGVGSGLLKSASQLNAIDPPGTHETLTDTITNDGAKPETVGVSSQKLGPYTQIASATAVLSDTSSPHFDYLGTPSNYEPIKFHVAAGQDRLSASIAVEGVVLMALVDPSGQLAMYSLPQGEGNYGNVQVSNPEPGMWTAFVWSAEGADGGFTGPVPFSASVATYVPFGQVSPSIVTLAPGQSAPVTLRVATPSTPGDSAGEIVLSGNRGPSFARESVVPVTLRSLIPNTPTSFQQVLTGGNGRAPSTGETFYYQFDVPAGRPELNANVTLADNPNNPFTMFLVNPNGQAVGQGANELPNSTPPGFTNVLGAQVHALRPDPGAWTLIVVFAPQVSGTAITEPFTVSTNETAQPASSGGLPSSTSDVLPAGKPQTYQVTVTNTSSAPAAYFVDPRLSSTTTLSLTSLTNATIPIPLTGSSVLPEFLVPTHTSAIDPTAQASGSTPIEFDAQAPAGDPDIGSTVGSSVFGSFTADPVAPGAWTVTPDVVGTFGSTPAPAENVTTAMTATANAFDPAVSSSTGDMWQASVDPSALTGLSPVVIGPHQTGTIAVTITPKGAAGSHQSGTLYVDVEDLFLFQINASIVNVNAGLPEPNGSETVAIPYSYTVG
jgi:hypothetical protein